MALGKMELGKLSFRVCVCGGGGGEGAIMGKTHFCTDRTFEKLARQFYSDEIDCNQKRKFDQIW